MELYINPNWTFKEIFVNIRAIRKSYEDILCSFSCLRLKEKVIFKKNVRDQIYSLNLNNYRKDLIWNYLNHYEFYRVLKTEASKIKR